MFIKFVAACVFFIYVDALRILDRNSSRSNIFFYLSTREFQDRQFKIDDVDFNQIKPLDKTIILVHGWTESHLRPHYISIRDEYLKKYICNVIMYEYSLLDTKGYIHAANMAPDLGELIAESVVELHNHKKLNFNKVHIIGHSLGCQIAGFIGKNIYRLTKEKVRQITALDAAGPLFNGAQHDQRLDRYDAQHVVVVHTDKVFIGMSDAVGSLDLFFNVGKPVQPGCTVLSILQDVSNAFCNHWASYRFFIRMINDPRYFGIRCGNHLYYQLGVCGFNERILYTEDISKDITGTFYINADSI